MMEHPDKYVREAECQIIQVLKKLEKQTGLVVDTILVMELEVTQVTDTRPRIRRMFNICLKPDDGAEREFSIW